MPYFPSQLLCWFKKTRSKYDHVHFKDARHGYLGTFAKCEMLGGAWGVQVTLPVEEM